MLRVLRPAIIISTFCLLGACSELGDGLAEAPATATTTETALPGTADLTPPEAEDDCPTDVEGVVVTEQGLRTTAPIGFDLYAPALAPETVHVIDAVGRRLVGCADIHVEIQVHTDTRRMTSFNARQSQAIAGAIRTRLGEAGVAETRLAACGYGESQPDVSTGLEPWDPAQNRVLFVRLPGPSTGHVCPTLTE